MGQRTATRSHGGALGDTELEDLRRQLEGGLETLEEATARYHALCALLPRRDWKARLRGQRELLEGARAREPGVLEALEALRRRAARAPNGAGEGEAVLRRVEAARGALSGALTRRFPEAGDGPLAERLARLDDRVLQPLLLPPPEGEQVVARGNTVLPSAGVLTLLLPLLAVLGLVAGPGAAALLLASVLGLTWVSGGRYQLTSERLLVWPRLGRPVEVPLASVDDGEVSVQRFLGSVRLRAHGVTLRHLWNARALAAQVSIRRHQELRRFSASEAPRERRVLQALSWRKPPPSKQCIEDDEWEGLDSAGYVDYGYLVLHPRWVAFLPCRFHEESLQKYGPRAGAVLLHGLTRPTTVAVPEWQNRDDVPVSADEVMTHLERFSDEELELLLRRAAAAPSSGPPDPTPFLLWDAAEVKGGTGERALGVTAVLQLYLGRHHITARLNNWETQEEIERIVARWPGRERLTTSGPDAAPGRG